MKKAFYKNRSWDNPRAWIDRWGIKIRIINKFWNLKGKKCAGLTGGELNRETKIIRKNQITIFKINVKLIKITLYKNYNWKGLKIDIGEL